MASRYASKHGFKTSFHIFLRIRSVRSARDVNPYWDVAKELVYLA